VAVARKLYYENVRVGDELQPLLKPALDRVAIARYAGASEDYNPNHVDEDHARRSGFPGVFAHGMMAMGYLGQLCAEWVRAGQVKRLSARFVKIIWPGDQLTCRGRVVAKRREGGEYYLDLEIWVENQKGELVVKGNSTTKLFHSPEDEDRQRRGLSPLIVEDDLRPSLVEVFERELPRIEVPPKTAARAGRSRSRSAAAAAAEAEEPLPAPKAPPTRTAARTARPSKKK
jgi:acyl dehydratase